MTQIFILSFVVSCLAASVLPSSAAAQEFDADFVHVDRLGCSQSWQETETIVHVALQLHAELATLSVEIASRSRGGSTGDPNSGLHWTGRDSAQCDWSGTASVDNDGQWTVQFAALVSAPENAAACRGVDGDGSFELVCSPELVAEGVALLDGQNLPLAPAGTLAVDVLRCENIEGLPPRMFDAANPGQTPTSPRSFYLAETASVTTTVSMSRGFVEARVVYVAP